MVLNFLVCEGVWSYGKLAYNVLCSHSEPWHAEQIANATRSCKVDGLVLPHTCYERKILTPTLVLHLIFLICVSVAHMLGVDLRKPEVFSDRTLWLKVRPNEISYDRRHAI